MMTARRAAQIVPSVLAADLSRLGECLRAVKAAGVTWVSVDVMDGHFVPNLSFGPDLVTAIKSRPGAPLLDSHLMVTDPGAYAPLFAAAGSEWVTFHLEACARPKALIKKLKALGCAVGVAIKPKTPAAGLLKLLPDIDLALVMTVEPGFGGQSFMPEMMDKVRQLRRQFKGLISVDGGVNRETAPQPLDAGADILVAGTAIFGQKDRKAAIAELRK